MIIDRYYPTWIIAPLFLFGIGAAACFAAWRSPEAPRFWRDFGAVGFVVCLAACAAFLLFGWQDSAAAAQSRILDGIERASDKMGKLTPDGQTAVLLYLQHGLDKIDIPAETASVEIGGERYTIDFLLRTLGAKRGQPGYRYARLAAVNDFTKRDERAAWQRLRDYLIAQDICQSYGGNRGAIVLEGQDERLARVYNMDISEWMERG